jgi:hypothetical protein
MNKMTQEAKAPPTLQELEGKVQRLTQQVSQDAQAMQKVDDAVARAIKSGDVAQVLEATDARTTAIKDSGKSTSQLKTAQSAVNSAKLSANAGKRADIHDAMRQDKSVAGHFRALVALGAEWVKLEMGEEAGSIIINSGGAEIKKTRAPSSNGGSRGTASWEVDGTSYTSRELIEAHQDMLTDKVREHFNSGNFRAFSMTREAERIHGLLTSGN